MPPRISELSPRIPPVIVQSQSPVAANIPLSANASPDVPQHSSRPKHWGQWAIVAVTVSLIFALAVVLFITRGPHSTPEYSLKQLKLAAQRQDREGVSQYVDPEAFAKSARAAIKSSLHTENAKDSDGRFFSTVLGAGLDYLGDGAVDIMITPESVISMLCGQSGSEVAKENLSSFADQKIDGFTTQGDLKTQAGGVLAKCFVRGLVSYATAKAAPTNEVVLTDQYDVKGVYESPTRFLIRFTSRDPSEPSFGWVFKRYSYSTWKLCELRMFENNTARTEQASR